jgi:hypothetical protein
VQKLLDYMMKLRARSIYRARKRWPRIWATTHGGRRDRELLARVNSCLPSWRPHRRRLDGHRESRRRGEKVEARGTRPGDGCRRRAYLPKPQSTGGTTVSHRSYLQAHCFYLAALSGHRRRESQRRWHESRRRSVVGSEQLKLIFFSTVP